VFSDGCSHASDKKPRHKESPLSVSYLPLEDSESQIFLPMSTPAMNASAASISTGTAGNNNGIAHSPSLFVLNFFGVASYS